MDEQNTKDTKSTSGDDAVLLLTLEEKIKNHLTKVDELQVQITKQREMVDDVFINDTTYQEHDKVAKEAAKIRSKTKGEIMKRPAVADLANKLKDFRLEKAELQQGLSEYLREYQRLSGLNEIEGKDGEIREIVHTAKLVRKSAYRP